jgi:hypothetical protein
VIQFVTAYDEPTRANLAACRKLLSACALVGVHASAERLIEELVARPIEPLAIWSHGNHEGPVDDARTPALPSHALARIRPRTVWAWACHTGTSFGARMAEAGWTWWGYTGVVSAPGTAPGEILIVSSALYVFSGRMTTSCWSHGCEVWVPTLSG